MEIPYKFLWIVHEISFGPLSFGPSLKLVKKRIFLRLVMIWFIENLKKNCFVISIKILIINNNNQTILSWFQYNHTDFLDALYLKESKKNI